MTPDPHVLLIEVRAKLGTLDYFPRHPDGWHNRQHEITNDILRALLALVEQQQQEIAGLTRERAVNLDGGCAHCHAGAVGGEVSSYCLPCWREKLAEIDRLRGAQPTRERLRELAIYAFTHHGHDAKMYNALAELAGMEPWGAQPQE